MWDKPAEGGRTSRGTRLPELLGGLRSSWSARGLRLGPLPPMPKPRHPQAAEGTRRGAEPRLLWEAGKGYLDRYHDLRSPPPDPGGALLPAHPHVKPVQ